MNAPQESSMNLPVQTHISRLGELIEDMKADTERAQKELHILRGYISQLSFVNKESDRDLNEFLTYSINEVRSRWSADWEAQRAELMSNHKKIHQVYQEHEDV